MELVTLQLPPPPSRCRAAAPAEAATRLPVGVEAVGGGGRGIYAFPVLRPEFCRRLVAELAAFTEACADVKGQPNSMNRHGVLLDEVGMR